MTIKELAELWMLVGPIPLIALALLLIAIDPFGAAYTAALALTPPYF